MLAIALFLAAAQPQMSISTSPRHVYKENDGRDLKGKTESFVFRLVVRGSVAQSAEPIGATVDLRAGPRTVKSVRLTGDALAALREKPGKFSADADALYALKLAFDEPVAEKVDRVSIRLESAGGTASLDVPVAEYAQKTRLVFPLKGDFMVVTGHVSAPQGHEERSQLYAYDVVGLGPHLELLTGDGSKNEDFVGFGKEVLAPAAGVVTYARDDVADNPSTGNQDFEKLLALADPPWGVGGNCAVIDHGNGEWSFLAHMKRGSVRVKKGDRVVQGQVVGQLGNSGATTGPHLHYHLMDGPKILVSDGLPARFENTCQPMPKPGLYCDAK
ncbi:MAG TPA: M23 family metallopeptidase [Thermoanaerobaculia bacterium]|nr:M23 family metallopeptidase [Thermoanaerobaculia bacterium]